MSAATVTFAPSTVGGEGGPSGPTTKVKKVKKVVKKSSSSSINAAAQGEITTTETTTTTTSSSFENQNGDQKENDHSIDNGPISPKSSFSRSTNNYNHRDNSTAVYYEEKMFCHHCDDSLAGHRYVLRDDHPYCIKCYENVFANNCDECSKIIGIDSKDLSYKDKHWHESCFVCAKCRASLVDKQFGSKADRIYCGSCYDAQFATRCDACGDVFRAGMKKMEYKTRQWHERCFVCCTCKNPIGTKSFIPKDHDIYCAKCYEDKFATKCIKCNKVITQGGVTYRNEPWHRECFTCTNCQKSLAGQRFTSREDKPYCAECFGELFSKRCTACSKPITGKGGLGSTRFVAFETLAWHNECFFCAICKNSMVGKGFIQEGDDIICPDCARKKMLEEMEAAEQQE